MEQPEVRKPDSEIYIPNAQLMIGAFRTWSNAKHFLEISNTLYASKKFQAAVPFATISLEESLKSIDLLNRFRRKQDMTREDWNKMKNHKYKLTHVSTEAAEIMEKMSPEEEQIVQKQQESYLPIPQVPKKEIIEYTRKMSHIHSHFQNLREKCLYIDWDETESSWVSFSDLSEDRQNALSYFVISEADGKIAYLEFYLETMVNNLRKRGILVGPLPYPSYSEYRTQDSFESLKNINKTFSKAEQVKYNQGMLTMQKFISLNAFEDVTFGIFRDTMLKYIRLIQKQDDDKWFPHPLYKALILALEAARNGDGDGNYMGMSDDSNLTYEGKPVMVIVVVVGKKGQVFEIKKIASIGNEEYEFPTDMIERILRTEILLERDAGKEVSVPSFIEALSVVGMKAKMIKEDELVEAVNYTKKLVAQGAFPNTPAEVLEEIRNKNREQWDEMMSETRSMIVTAYGPSKYPSYQMFFTPTKMIPKFKARLTIMNILQMKYFSTS